MNMLDESVRVSWDPSPSVCVLSDLKAVSGYAAQRHCLLSGLLSCRVFVDGVVMPSSAVCSQGCSHGGFPWMVWRILSREADSILQSESCFWFLQDRIRPLGCSQLSSIALPMLYLRILAPQLSAGSAVSVGLHLSSSFWFFFSSVAVKMCSGWNKEVA